MIPESDQACFRFTAGLTDPALLHGALVDDLAVCGGSDA